MLDKNFDYVGKEFIVKEEFKALCCKATFKPGRILKVWKHPTPNRLYVETINSSGHRVKRSTFNRCCELTGEGNYENKNKEIT
jgi:tRNA-binding EMAP/Myf-like protein